MKSKSKKNGLFMIFGCLMFCFALMCSAMFGEGSFVAFASETEPQAPTITSIAGGTVNSGIAPMPNAIVGEEYKKSPTESYKVIATGSTPRTYYAKEYVEDGFSCLPEGLHLNSETGEFYGTPTKAGMFIISITVSNEYGSATAGGSINIYNATDKPTITTESLPNGAVGSSYYQEITFDGYYASGVECEVVSGLLPTGLNIGRVGVTKPIITGTPTTTGTFEFTLSINNGAGIATKGYSITITEETVRPSLIASATTINEEDKFSSIDSSSRIHVVKGKSVNIQLVASGTNTTDNPIKFTLFGTNGVLPDGLTMSDTGLITGTPSDDIETTDGQKKFNTYMQIGNKTISGEPQSTGDWITIVVHDNGYVDNIKLNPKTTSVARGGERQFAIEWTGYGDVDKSNVTWYFNSISTPTSSQTAISNTGLLTVGADETRTTLYVRVKDNKSGKENSETITVIDHTHQTELVAKVEKTCETDGCDKHYECKICDGVFKDALATESTTLEALKIAKGHEYGTIIAEQPATCVSKGKYAYYKCSVCNKLFNSEKVETTETELEIAIVPNAHKFGTLQTEVPANCATEGTKAHKDCEYCHKHFDNDDTEITDLTIAKNDNHLKNADVWVNDATGHWHACTRVGCKNGGKLDYATHTRSAETATETNDIHCTVCEYVIENKTDHVHNLETIAGHSKTCYADGAKTYYVCSKGEHPCGKYFEDSAGNTEITEEINTWKRIPASHTLGEWQNEIPATVDDFGTKAHKDCTICHKHFDNEGNEMSDEDLKIAKLTPTDPTPTDPTPTEPTEPSDKKDNSLSGGAIAGIVVGSVAVAGIGGFALVWFVIKKKKWADLIAVFKKLFKKN